MVQGGCAAARGWSELIVITLSSLSQVGKDNKENRLGIVAYTTVIVQGSDKVQSSRLPGLYVDTVQQLS